MQIKTFTFNIFSENTYIVSDDSGSCIIIDPGMSNGAEQNQITNFIKEQKLTPARLINTHCHVDHVLGNKFIFDTYGLLPECHEGELATLDTAPVLAATVGIPYELSPRPTSFLPASGTLTFGNSSMEIIFAPGHSPAHLCFYSAENKFLIGGDVLFYRSIGRTDLPGGNHYTLIESIRNNIFCLPDDTIVYPGHGSTTSIGEEKQLNPFVR